jgi:hypothetical protein
MHEIQHLLSQIGDSGWQDVTLAAGNVFFCFTLIPMLRQPERPPLLTCIPSALALLAGGFVFASLHLWLTALTQTITGLQWLVLAFKAAPNVAGRPIKHGLAEVPRAERHSRSGGSPAPLFRRRWQMTGIGLVTLPDH